VKSKHRILVQEIQRSGVFSNAIRSVIPSVFRKSSKLTWPSLLHQSLTLPTGWLFASVDPSCFSDYFVYNLARFE
jgi:hypothetical protein